MNDLIDPATKTADAALKTAESISNFGALVVISAFAIIMCVVMMIYFFASHRRMTKNMEKASEESSKALNKTLDELKNYLCPLSESAKLSTYTTILAIAENNFKFSVENVLNVIEKIRTENHIDNETATKAKLRRIITNIHNERKSYFSNFEYSGHKVDFYTDPKWIDLMVETAFPEIYDNRKSKARTNVKTAYDSIYLEFRQNLLTK